MPIVNTQKGKSRDGILPLLHSPAGSYPFCLKSRSNRTNMKDTAEKYAEYVFFSMHYCHLTWTNLWIHWKWHLISKQILVGHTKKACCLARAQQGSYRNSCFICFYHEKSILSIYLSFCFYPKYVLIKST